MDKKRIGLIDVDGHNFPNLPLMKISAHHKSLGDSVGWYEPLVGATSKGRYDVVYMSKVFDFTPDYVFPLYADVVIEGGTGYGLEHKLPKHIEGMYPDYDLYTDFDEAYGFLTRGCPRGCGFCIVGKKEGFNSYQVADLSDFWRGQKVIKLLDPNLLACKGREQLLQQLIDSQAYIDFTQGLDARLLCDDISEMIMRCKIKMVHFAWDGVADSELIVHNLMRFKEVSKIDERKARVYVLVNYDTELEFDLERVYRLREMGFDPYVMVYNKENAPPIMKRLQRWVNNKRIWRMCGRFEEYGR